MKVIFAADHAGFDLKESLKSFVSEELQYEVEDFGAHALTPGDDYPLIIRAAMEKMTHELQERPDMKAIICGKSGQGEEIAANRIKGIRAVMYHGGVPEVLTLSREHNDANVLSLGSAFVSAEEGKEAVRLWLSTLFSGEERHVRRIAQLDA